MHERIKWDRISAHQHEVLMELEDEARADAEKSGVVFGPSERVRDLEKHTDWMRQTVHRAHHGEIPLDDCKMNTCDAALKLLGRRP